jgi:hypothetical protein
VPLKKLQNLLREAQELMSIFVRSAKTAKARKKLTAEQ